MVHYSTIYHGRCITVGDMFLAQKMPEIRQKTGRRGVFLQLVPLINASCAKSLFMVRSFDIMSFEREVGE